MRFTVSSSTLLSHMAAVSKVISPKNTIPALDCFLFNLQGGKLSITASDSETTLITSLDVVDTEDEGLFAVSAKMLLDPLKDFPEQPITFEVNMTNYEVLIFSMNGRYSLVGQNPQEYPLTKELSSESTGFTVSSSDLLSGITRTIFATAEDELRPVMNGICFDIKEDNTTMVGSDGHKLMKYTSFDIKANKQATFILPKKPATVLRTILPKEQGEITIEFDQKNACFRLKEYTMICRLIEGRYPNYNSVIPRSNPNKIIVDRLSLLAAAKRVAAFSSQQSNLVKLQIAENNMVISAQDHDFSTSAEETISCQLSGTAVRIGFKSTYMIEILNNMQSQEIILELADQSRPGLILPAQNEENKELLGLLMPIMLND